MERMNKEKLSFGFAAFVFFLLIPLILILIFLLPENTKIALSLNTLNPSAYSLLTSGYTHLTFTHFISNFIAYLFIMPFIFYFDFKRNMKMLFLVLIFLFLLLPIFYSILSVGLFSYFGANVLDKGFSTILAALIGYLPVSYIYFLKDERKINFSNSYYVLLLFFSFNLSLITLINGWYLILAVIVPLFLLCLYFSLPDLRKIRDFYLDLSGRKSFGLFHIWIVLLLWIVALLLCFIASIGLFPASLNGSSGTTNIFAHYVGYAYGFTVPAFVSIKLLKWKT
jgi:hypothetical protein